MTRHLERRPGRNCPVNGAPCSESQVSQHPSCLRSRQRPEVTQHRRDELGDRRMNVHGPLQNGVWRLGIHDVQDAVNRLVAARTENRRAQDLLTLRVDQRPDKSESYCKRSPTCCS